MLNNNSVGKKPEKYTGILLHPTSFPSPYGIGELGASAYKFIDFLVRSGLNTWQVLPLGHTGFGDSPYQPFSAFAGQQVQVRLVLKNSATHCVFQSITMAGATAE